MEVTEGQPLQRRRKSNYKYIGKHKETGGHVFSEDGNRELFHYKKHGHASWGLFHNGKSYEFARSLKDDE